MGKSHEIVLNVWGHRWHNAWFHVQDILEEAEPWGLRTNQGRVCPQSKSELREMGGTLRWENCSVPWVCPRLHESVSLFSLSLPQIFVVFSYWKMSINLFLPLSFVAPGNLLWLRCVYSAGGPPVDICFESNLFRVSTGWHWLCPTPSSVPSSLSHAIAP